MITADNTPTLLPVNGDAIPAAMKARRQFVVWRDIIRDGKSTKVPFQTNGRPAKTNDPATWNTFDQVMAAYGRGGYAGIGYVFANDDPFAGVDLDGCIDADGNLADWAKEIMVAADGVYAEKSPTQTGAKMIVEGRWPGEKTGKKTAVKDAPKVCGKEPGIEIYSERRFFALTGHRFAGMNDPQPRQPFIDALARRYWPDLFGRKITRTNGNGHHREPSRQSVVDRARKYLAKIPPAVSGQGGHNATYHAACVLVVDFDLTKDEAFALLSDWNQTCDPPWSEYDLRHKIEDADKETGERGKLVQSTASNGYVANGSALPPSENVWLANGRTDAANAKRFIAAHGRDIHWIEAWKKWVVWTGQRWEVDERRRVSHLAKLVAAKLWDEVKAAAEKQADAKLIQELIKFAKSSNSATSIKNMIDLARSEPGIAILPGALDSHPWLINVQNGIVDLHDGSLLPHDRSYLLTKMAPVEFILGPEAECPEWEAALNKIMGNRDDLLVFVQRLLGSALAGEISEHLLAIFWGDGSNGKTLVAETLLEIFGPYAGKASQDLLLAKDGNSHPTEKADLFGKRLVFAVESDAGRQLSEATVKELTGGDTINARRMREDFWSFEPQHTVVLATNHKPRVRSNDHGLWRRLCLVPFAVRFWDPARGESGPGELQADKHLKQKLRAEHAGIFAWLVRGCIAWQHKGLNQPAAVRDATSEYRKAEDVLGKFMAECTIDLATATVKASGLRASYEVWCKANGESPCSGRRFGEYIASTGVKKRTSNGTWYDGIGLVIATE